MSIELKQLTLEHSHDILRSISGNVAEYFYDFKTIEETGAWVNNEILNQRNGTKEEYVIFDDGKFVGMISPSFSIPEQAEIGIWIAVNQQGKGYGKQALLELIKLLTERGIRKIIYETDFDNLASINLAKSLNFELESDLNKNLRFIYRV